MEVFRGGHRLYTEATEGEGTPLVLMHGFPDNTHLYDRLMPHLAGRRVVRFDFLGWGQSDKPTEGPYTADAQVGDVAAVVEATLRHYGVEQVVLVAHDASGPPAIDYALAHPEQVARLVLLNTYYHWMAGLRRPPAIALFSTPGVRALARAVVRRWPIVDRKIYAWQVGGFVRNPRLRAEVVGQLYKDFPAARPAFWSLNNDLMGAVISRLRRRGDLRRFPRPVRVIFGARDRYLNASVARAFASLFPHNELHLLGGAGHYVQVDAPRRVAELAV